MINKIYEEYFQIIDDYYGRYYENDPLESFNKLMKHDMRAIDHSH